MKRVGLVIAILVAALLLGEIALVLGYIVLAGGAWAWFKRRWVSASVSGLFLAALLLHVLGYKLYGRAVIDQKRESLKNPKQAIALESPSRVIFQDGTSIQLPDVFFPKSVSLLEGETNYHQVFQDRFGIYAQLGHNQYRQEWMMVEVLNPLTNTSKGVCLRKATYGCGNTWFPTLFPGRLPSHLREDMAVTLIRAGVAIPTAEYLVKAPLYHDPLMRALRAGKFWNFPRQSPEVVRLGRWLIENRPDDFEIGACLLIQVEDLASYPSIIAEIKKRRGYRPLSIDELDTYRSYAGLLLQVDNSEAEPLMTELFKHQEPNAFWGALIAGLLAEHGDMSGFDHLTMVLTKTNLSAEYRKSLGTQLTLSFRFLREFDLGWGMPEEVADLFPDWYAENRQQLRWVKHPDGRSGFAVSFDGVFDETYLKTMEKYSVKAQSIMTQH